MGAGASGRRAAACLLALSCAAAAPPSAKSNLAPPSVAWGPLFRDVALAGVFDDGKAWADEVPRRPPASILRDYRLWRDRSPAGLRRFVDANFTAAPPPVATSLPPAGLTLQAHIEALWPALTRRTPAVRAWSSLLPLPNPYVVPGGRFREIYYWDSYFTMLGFGPREAPLRHAMVDNFADLIRRFGHVPNGNRTYYLSRSQPPFFFEMVALTDPAHRARAFARYLKPLKAEHEWWMRGERTVRRGQAVARVVRMPDGAILNRYWDDRDAPRDESYLADVRVAASAQGRPGVYRDIRAAAESGWDFSSRWLADRQSLATIRTTDIVPPDLNSLLTGLEEAISQGCAVLRDRRCASDFHHRARVRGAAIRHYLWNSTSHVFDDYLWRERRLAGNVSAATFYPLFAGIATDDQARAVAAAAGPRLLQSGGLAATDKQTGQQWDAPNGWAPLQWIAVRGLRNYGEIRLANEIARRWLNTVERVYASTGKLLEKYDVVTAQPGGGGEYRLQDGFGWTNGVTAALLALPLETPPVSDLEDREVSAAAERKRVLRALETQ